MSCVQHSGLHLQRFSHNPGLLSRTILLSSILVLPRCGRRQSCAWLRCCEQGAHAGVRGVVHATRRCFFYVLASWTFRVGKKQNGRCFLPVCKLFHGKSCTVLARAPVFVLWRCTNLPQEKNKEKQGAGRSFCVLRDIAVVWVCRRVCVQCHRVFTTHVVNLIGWPACVGWCRPGGDGRR